MRNFVGISLLAAFLLTPPVKCEEVTWNFATREIPQVSPTVNKNAAPAPAAPVYVPVVSGRFVKVCENGVCRLVWVPNQRP